MEASREIPNLYPVFGGGAKPSLISLDDEDDILGGLLLDPNAYLRVCDILKPEHFYAGANQAIYRAIAALAEAGKAVDLMSVAAWLRDRGQLDQAGGQKRLLQLIDHTVSAVNIDFAAQRVADKYTRRMLRAVASEIISLCETNQPGAGLVETAAIVEMAEQKIFSLTAAGAQSGLRALEEFLFAELSRIERIQAGKEMVGIPTGFYDLDAMTQGLKPESLWILAGRPSMGKSAIAANVIRNVAAQGQGVALFSLEMSGGQIGRRLLAAESRIENTRLGSGAIADHEWEKFGQAYNTLSQLPIKIDDSQSVNISTIRSQCRKMKAQSGLGLIVVDYLHLMLDGSDDEVRELGQITRQCKRLARELKCSFMLLSQLSRATESRANKRPVQSDLRQSGAIEQDADVIAFVYRDEYYNPETPDRGIAELIISKQRDGAVGTVKLLFEPQFSQFRNLARSLND